MENPGEKVEGAFNRLYMLERHFLSQCGHCLWLFTLRLKHYSVHGEQRGQGWELGPIAGVVWGSTWNTYGKLTLSLHSPSPLLHWALYSVFARLGLIKTFLQSTHCLRKPIRLIHLHFDYLVPALLVPPLRVGLIRNWSRHIPTKIIFVWSRESFNFT